MKKFFGLVLIIIGGFILFHGLHRQDSIAGRADSAGTSIANAVDGGSRTPNHTLYIVGGSVLAIVGLLAVAGGKRSTS